MHSPMPTHSTSELWTTLCSDLQGRRSLAPREEYERIAREFLEQAARMLRPDSTRLAEAYEIAGDICIEADSLADAFADYSKALEIDARAGAHPAAGRVGGKIAGALISRGRHAEAIPFIENALAFFDAAGDHSRHPALLDDLARAKKQTGDFEGAREVYRRAIDIVEQLHGPNHPERALLFNNLGVDLTEAGRYEEAETALLQGLALRETLFGANHPEVAHSLTNIGVLYHTRGDFAQARSYYSAAIEIYRRFFEEDSPEIQALRNYLERLSKYS